PGGIQVTQSQLTGGAGMAVTQQPRDRGSRPRVLRPPGRDLPVNGRTGLDPPDSPLPFPDDLTPPGRPSIRALSPPHAPGGTHSKCVTLNETVSVPSGSPVVRSMRWKTTREPSAPTPTTLNGPPTVNCSPGGLL